MFAEHQPRIAAVARQEPDMFHRAIVFAVLSARVPLTRAAPGVLEMLDESTPDSERRTLAFGYKGSAVAWHWDNRIATYELCERIWHDAENTRRAADSLVYTLADTPGLGLAKAGFVAQLAYGVSGCLDSRNVTQYRLNGRTFDAHRFKRAKRLATRRRIVAYYNGLCETLGGTAYLWNQWCMYCAEQWSGDWSPHAVSALHLTPFELEE